MSDFFFLSVVALPRKVLFLFFCGLAHGGLANFGPDTAKTAINLGVQNYYGFIIPHSQAIRTISHSHPRGIEADISFHFADAKSWHYLKGYPRLGASIIYTDFANPAVLGRAYALLLYAEPFLAAHKSFSLAFRLGTGLAYLTRVYHPQKNPDNLFFGSAISFPLAAGLTANYRLRERFLLRAGVHYNHISNGGLRQPNKGINYPTVATGFNYTLVPVTFSARLDTADFKGAKKPEYRVALLASSPDGEDGSSKKIPLIGITALAGRRIGRLSALTAGAEWIADYTIRQVIRQRQLSTPFHRGALLAGHELHIGKFRFSQQLGIYVYAPYKARDPVYQRYGLEYFTNRNLYLGLNLKAHRQVADFLDARLGWRF